MNLLQASGKLFARAQEFIIGSLWLAFVILSLTIISLWKHDSKVDAFFVLLIGALQVLQAFCKLRALKWTSLGDEPRRMAQFQSGLGFEPSCVRCADIEEIIGICDAAEDQHYWLSNKPIGPKRMAEMVLESSFYTKYLASRCAKLFIGVSLAGFGLGVIALVLGSLSLWRTGDRTGQILVSAIVFFMTSDFVTVGLQYRDLKENAMSTHEAAVSLLASGEVSNEAAFELAMSYNVGSAQAPPLFSYFHFKNKDSIDQLFKRHYGVLLGLSAFEG